MSSDIILSLEAAWSAIQDRHPELGPVVLVTGRRRQKSESNTLGQHCAGQWTHPEGKDKLAEIVIFGERLANGGEAVMQTLLHEATHELCHIRGVKDTSNRNRYHNLEFARTAEELGLQRPAQSGGPHLGYSNCTITTGTVLDYQGYIKRLGHACQAFVAPSLDVKVTVRKPPRKAACACPDGQNEIPWSKALAARAEMANGIICGACRRPFTEIDSE